MPITLTGSKYSGAVVSLVGTTLTASGVSFAEAQFVVPRLVAFFDSANSFKAVAYVRSYASQTSLVLEYAPFDPVTMLPVAIVNTDVFNVSLNLLELATTGLSVVNTDVTVSDQLIFGVSGNQRSLCLYDEDKDVRQTGGSSWLLRGGVTCFSHLLALASTDYSNPVNMVFQSASTRIVTSSTAAHFFWLGGSLTAQATPAYVGGFPGAAGAGSFVLSRVINSEMDLISANTGRDWGTYPERHVLRDTFVYLSKSNGIGIRWGNGIISGGGAKMRTTLPLAVFGSNGETRIAVGAGPDKRFVVVDVAGNAVFDFGGGIDATNLICSSRASARTTTAVHNYYWRNTYSNMVEGSKLVIRRPADGALVHNDTVGADGTSVPTIFEASVRQNIPLEIYSQWSYGLYRYGYQIVSGSFETSQYDLGADGFSNEVNFGGPMVQSPDPAITESDKSVVLGYSALPSAASFYDYAAAYLEENYAGEMATLVTRSGNTIDAGSHDVVLTSNGAVFGFDGTTITANVGTFTGDMTTTGVITLANGATFVGTRTDANGTVAPPKTVSITGITAGSRLQIYNVTTATEVVNEIVAGTSYTATYDEGTGYTTGDTVRVRLTYTSGTTAKLPYSAQAVAGSSGWSILAAQQDDTVYATLGIDGSAVTEFVADFPNVQVDISDPDGTTRVDRLYAWFVYTQSSSADGIRQWFGGIVPEDAANFRIITDTLDLKIDNLSATGVTFTDGRRLYRDDDASPLVSSTTGGGSITLYAGKVYTVSVGGSALTPTESAKLMSLPDSTTTATAVRSELSTELGRVDVAVSSRLAAASYTAPPTASDNAAATVTALESTEIPANVVKVNGYVIDGTGTEADPWGPV